MKFKKLFLFLTIALMLLCGCSALDHDSPESLAASFIEAVIDGDSDAVWEAFTPETQKELVAAFGDDEDLAEEQTLLALQEGLKRKYDIDITLTPDDELLQRITGDLLAEKENKFVQIDDEWFIKLTSDDKE